jgi:hypothetical protein
MRRNLPTLVALTAALLLSACGSVRIARINADPGHYRNRTVTVTGTVTNAVGLLGTGGYQLEDGTGKLYVISQSGIPQRGARVKVTGTVQSGVNILGRSIGTALREQHHKVQW